jgi:hypothetical protein
MSKKNPHFHIGSIIVKEKLPTKDSNKPELLTVMVKRSKGYNPNNGDWEYIALDGSGKEIKASGKLYNCQNCHLSVKETDFVFRSYLPSEIREILR